MNVPPNTNGEINGLTVTAIVHLKALKAFMLHLYTFHYSQKNIHP